MGEIDYNEYRSQLPSMYGRSRNGSRSGSRGGASRGARRREIAPRRMIRTRPMPPRPEVPEPDPVDTVPIGEPGNVLWRKRLSNNDLGLDQGHGQGIIRFNDGVRIRDSDLVRPYHDEQGNQIDRNTYFRQILFSGLEWSDVENVNSNTQEEATARIRVFVQGESVGEYEIRISHDPERMGVTSATAGGGLPITHLHTTPEIRQSFCDEAFQGGYVELCGEAGSEGPFELHFYSNLQA